MDGLSRMVRPALSISLLLWACAFGARSEASRQETQPSPAILSKSQLTPPLRSRLKELRFSPDGKYILVQDESTIYLLTSDPLVVRFQIEASNAEPARFSPDSQKLIIPTRSMGVEWRALPDGAVLDTTVLASDNSCYEARLSPTADVYACIDRNLVLRIFDISKRQQIMAEHIGEVRSAYLTLKVPVDPSLIPGWWRWSRLRVLQTFLQFSPDSRFVVASAFHEQDIGIDLLAKNKIKLLPPFPQALDNHTFRFVASDRVVLRSKDHAGALSVVSFPEGGPHGTMPSTDLPLIATDERYAVVSDSRTNKTSVIDSLKNTVEEFQAEKADILGDNVVRYDQLQNELTLSRLGVSQPKAQIRLPPDFLSSLTVAAVSDGLRSIAVGVAGGASTFDTSTGESIAHVENVEGAWFDGEESLYAEVLQRNGVGLQKINLGEVSSSTPPPWFSVIDQTKTRLMFSGPVLISVLANWCAGGTTPEYAFSPEFIPYPHLVSIQAWNLTNGNRLWSRTYGGEPSEMGTPYADQSSARFVVGWYANSRPARRAARKASRPTQRRMAAGNISDKDAFFEVVDALTGETAGGVLVEHGLGPASFDSLSSEGDWLLLVSAGSRVDVFSLSSGKEVLTKFALCTALSGENGVLGLAEEHGRFSMYNLNTGKKFAEVDFPENVIFAHFSKDGNHLLALTEHQAVYIVDVGGRISRPSPD